MGVAARPATRIAWGGTCILHLVSGWVGFTPRHWVAEVLDEGTAGVGAQLLVTTTEAPLAFFLIDSTPFMQASLVL